MPVNAVQPPSAQRPTRWQATQRGSWRAAAAALAVLAARRIGRPLDEVKALNNLAAVYQARGDLQAALALNEAALELLQESSDPRAVAVAQSLLGDTHSQLGNWPTARELYTRALDTIREVDDKEFIAGVLHNYANLSM